MVLIDSESECSIIESDVSDEAPGSKESENIPNTADNNVSILTEGTYAS